MGIRRSVYYRNTSTSITSSDLGKTWRLPDGQVTTLPGEPGSLVSCTQGAKGIGGLLLTLAWLAVIVLGTLALVGCAETPQETRVRTSSTAESLMPPGHRNVTRLNDYWYTFEMNVAGRNRKFLFGWWWGSHGEQGRTVTELRD